MPKVKFELELDISVEEDSPLFETLGSMSNDLMCEVKDLLRESDFELNLDEITVRLKEREGII